MGEYELLPVRIMIKIWAAYFQLFMSLVLIITYCISIGLHHSLEYYILLHFYNLVGWFCVLCAQITIVDYEQSRE